MIFDFELNGVHAQVSCPDTPMSPSIVQEVLTGKTYPVFTFFRNVRTVVDIGAHVGAFAIRASLTFPEAIIHSYEPNPDLWEHRQHNSRPNIHLHQKAVSDANGTVLLSIYEDDSVFSSMSTTLKRRIAKRIRVPTIDAARLPENIDILKIDTEGHELPILRRLGDRLFDIPYIYLEFHSKRDRLELDEMLLPTHDLHWGNIIHSGCGELFYLKHGAGPEDCSVMVGV